MSNNIVMISCYGSRIWWFQRAAQSRCGQKCQLHPRSLYITCWYINRDPIEIDMHTLHYFASLKPKNSIEVWIILVFRPLVFLWYPISCSLAAPTLPVSVTTRQFAARLMHSIRQHLRTRIAFVALLQSYFISAKASPMRRTCPYFSYWEKKLAPWRNSSPNQLGGKVHGM